MYLLYYISIDIIIINHHHHYWVSPQSSASLTYLWCRVDGELELALLAVLIRELLHQQRCES